jgi:hypothetical protein
MSIFDIVTSVIKPSTPPKVGFEDILFAMNNPQYIIISTFSYEEQEFLIKGTTLANMEERIINDIIQRGKVYEYNIIVYGKNSTDTTVEVKYTQLIRLGFIKVFVYYGGVFEWVLLREIYGEDLFPCINYMKNTREDVLLKWKPKKIL